LKRKIVSITVALFLLLTMLAIPAQAATPEEIGDSIEAGIAWLISVQNVNGSWGPAGSDQFGTTGLILVKLQDYAFEKGYDGPFDTDYPYKANVENGLNFLFGTTNTVAITAQPAGNPDTDSDGLGVSVNNRVYDTGILMMAIAAGRDPAQVVAAGPLTEWSYDAVLQDAADWMAYAQTDAGSGRGGWFYGPQNGGSSSDQSNAGYAILGLLYAQATVYGYQSDIPGFVAAELDYWIDYVQSDWDDGVNSDYDGGSGYTGPDYWVNSLKTGNLLTQMSFVGDDSSVERAQEALNYIGAHWDNDWVQGWKNGSAVQHQATYCLMKGFETMNVDVDGVPGVADWYQDMADALVAEQNPNGSWPSSPAYVWYYGTPSHPVSPELATAWALLTLERFAPPPPVDVVVDVPECACDNEGYDVTVTYTVERHIVDGTLTVKKDGDVYDTVVLNDFIGTATETYNLSSDTPGTHTWKAELDVAPEGGTAAHAEDEASINVCETPQVSGIPDQTAPFQPFDLDDYLTYSGPLSVSWSASGVPAGWTLNIDGDNVATVTAPEGASDPVIITFTASVECCTGVVCSSSDDATFVPNQAPVTSEAYADPGCLWPPNHKFVDITIMGVTDPDGDPVTIIITGITSDEPTASDEGSGGAKHAPDADGVGTDTASVRVERSGDGDGRVYVITFIASDGRGGETEGSVAVGVPHDQASKKSGDCPAIDSGQNYDATEIN
jgi:hypothetical protein